LDLQFIKVRRSLHSYQDANSPTVVARLLILVWACYEILIRAPKTTRIDNMAST
jgi:hypothetical protein